MAAGSTTESPTVRRAREDAFESGLDLGDLEHSLALEAPGLRSTHGLRAIGRLLLGIALIAPFAGALAPLGGSARDLFSGTAPLRPELEHAIVLGCFWVGAVGLLWSLVSWWATGRPRSGTGILAAAAAVASAAFAAWWTLQLEEPIEAPARLVPIALVGLLGVVALVARAVGSTATTARQLAHERLARELDALPAAEREALLRHRAEVVAALRERGLLDERTAREATEAPLGGWWRLPSARERRRR